MQVLLHYCHDVVELDFLGRLEQNFHAGCFASGQQQLRLKQRTQDDLKISRHVVHGTVPQTRGAPVRCLRQELLRCFGALRCQLSR